MAIQKIFAYNTGSLISGTTQVGDIAISEANVEYSANFGGLQWWGGPDETNGYVIAHTDPSGSHDGAAGGSANLGFWRSTGLTDSDFLILCNSIPPRIGLTPFTNTNDAYVWLNANGYWTSYVVSLCDSFTFSGNNANTTTNSATNDSTGGWDSSAYSTETYSGPVSVTFQTSTNGNTLMGGFSYNPTANLGNTYTDTSYGIYTYSGNQIEIYENGNQAAVVGLSSNVSSSDVWKVDYNGTNVRYYRNDILLYTSSNPVTQPLHVFFALLTPNQGVTNVCVIGTQSPTPTITPTPTGTPVAATPTPTPSVTPTMYYYSVSGYSCGVSCSLVGSYTVMSPTPLTIGYFYNNPENRGYTFEILSLIPQVGGAYDLTGEPGFAVCTDACNQPPPSPTPTVTNTQTPTVTTTPTPSVTNTQTPSVTPTLTPTPSTSPIPVTGYGYNLVVLPYEPPTSGNTIFPLFTTPGSMSGTTNPNTFDVNGIYWNTIDNSSVDRTSYYSGMTGVSVTAYFTQNSNTVIYSGSPTAFIFETGGGSGFNYNPGARPGQLVLTQSASTNFVTGQTVNISYTVNGAGVTPTPTATSVTPTPTPTSGGTGNGWLFYSPDNQPVLSAPTNNGNTTFIYGSTGTYSPNYTGGTFNLYFNTGTTIGTSYLSQFSTLDTAGGTITISQGSSVAIYSGTSLNYQINSGFLVLSVSSSAQMIQSASTRFVSGTTINVVVS
jgi:hypothetical protein